jgi:hypothetical protein
MLRRYDLPPGEPHACVCPPRPATHVPPKCAASSCTTEAGGEGRDGKMLKHFQKMFVKTFWKNVGSNIFSAQMLVQLFTKNVGSTYYLKKVAIFLMRWDGWKLITNSLDGIR